MSTVTDLLTDLEARGVRLEADGDKLVVDAPEGALTDEIKAALNAHKRELLEHLRTRGEPWDTAEASRLMGQAVAEANRLLGETEIEDWTEHDAIETEINRAVEARDLPALRDACRRLAEWAESTAEREGR